MEKMFKSLRDLEFDSRYTDGWAVVTGGNDGVGLATTKMLLSYNMKVLVLDKFTDKITKEITNNENLIVKEVDITETDKVIAMMEEVKTKWGIMTVLVNSAGIAEACDFLDQKPEIVSKIIDINLKATMLVAQYCGNQMREGQFGTLVNIISGNAFNWIEKSVVYTATKQALVSFSDLLRAELANDNVRVMGVYPGPMRTGMYVDEKSQEGMDEKGKEIINQISNAPIFMSPDQIARSIEFQLLLDHSTIVRGIFITPVTTLKDFAAKVAAEQAKK